MRTVVDAGAFSEVLSIVGKVIQKSAVPVLEGVLIQTRNGRCSLTASDSNTWLTVTLPAQGENFAFVFRKPLAVARACRYFKGNLVLELHDTESEYPPVTLACGQRSGTFDTFPAKDYPLPPPLEESVSFSANAAALLKRVERVKYAVREPQGFSYRADQTCVQFSGNDVFCLDGYRAACDTDTALTFPKPFLTRGSSLSFLKLMGGSEVTVQVGTEHIWFSADTASICTRKEGFETFNLRNAVPTNFSEEFTVSPKEFLQELEYLEGFQPKRQRFTTVFCGGRLFLDKAESKCSTLVGIDGESEIAVGFDPRFMKDALTQFRDAPRVKVKLTSSIGPIVLEAEGRNDFALVLPVRLHGLMAA